ncbi:MAG: acetyl-CoA C-acyltransferase [Candidatus Dormibacteria bacterium]
MSEVVIVSAARTPFGRLAGKLAKLQAPELGAHAIRGALHRAGVDGNDVDHLIMGTVIAAGQGQVPSRQAGLLAGLPPAIPSFTVNKVCASSLKAVNLGAILIAAGEADVVVAGGMESMSNAPHLLPSLRRGVKMGDATVIDAMIRDGLCCPVDNVHMGVHGGQVAKEQGYTREQQDAYALQSQQRYEAARVAGKFTDEIVPITIGDETISEDEPPRPDTTLDKLSSLKPAFEQDGSITAGNAPGVNDGAAAVVLMSRERAEREGKTILAEWIGGGDSADEHPYLATVPALAIERALAKTHGSVRKEDIVLYEINEAFAAVSLNSIAMLGVQDDVVNVNGGAIAVGHPVGASGARILMSLIFELRRRGGGVGAAGICSGLAQGEATLVRVGTN